MNTNDGGTLWKLQCTESGSWLENEWKKALMDIGDGLHGPKAIYKYCGDLAAKALAYHLKRDIIVLQNVFGADVAMTLLLFKIDKEHWPLLKTVTNYLGYLYTHELKDTHIDLKIAKMLREL